MDDQVFDRAKIREYAHLQFTAAHFLVGAQIGNDRARLDPAEEFRSAEAEVADPLADSARETGGILRGRFRAPLAVEKCRFRPHTPGDRLAVRELAFRERFESVAKRMAI